MINMKERTCHFVDFTFSADYSVKNERKRRDGQIPKSSQRAEEAMEHGGDGDINCRGVLGMVPKGIEKRLRELEIR